MPQSIRKTQSDAPRIAGKNEPRPVKASSTAAAAPVATSQRAIWGGPTTPTNDGFASASAARVSSAAAATGQAIALDMTASQRPVFLAPDGAFTVHATGAPPANALEKGDALFRAGELVDDARSNVFAALPKETRQKVFEQLEKVLATPPEELNANQALQLRASGATVLLHLLEGTKEPALFGPMLARFEAVVKAEPNKRLQENLVFHLSNSPIAKSGEAKKLSDKLLPALAPVTPPYEKWFANGNKTVKLDWKVGDEFIKPFTRDLKSKGWKETSAGVYKKTFNEPGVGETNFEIRVKLSSGIGLYDKLKDPEVHIVGYDGHSEWGKNQVRSMRRIDSLPDGGDGKLYFSNLCVGKSQLDAMKEKYPNLQITTTYGSSTVETDVDGLAKFFSKRAPWSEIEPFLDRHDDEWDRNNFLTPISTQVREKVLDRDNDGQADYLDKHFNVSTFDVKTDTRREFRPVQQSRPAEVLDGTKVLLAAQVLNTVSEFSGILTRVNKDSRVVPTGWFEPQAGEAEVVKFTKVKGRKNGAPMYEMKVNARYSHMSEESLKATCMYEFNRWLQSSGEQKMDPVDRKISAVLSFAQSLDIDESPRDDAIFNQFLERYNLPKFSREHIKRLLDAEKHEYAGSKEMVKKMKAKLSPEALEALKRPAAGEPIRYS